MANEVDGQNREDVERQGLAKHFVSLRFTSFHSFRGPDDQGQGREQGATTPCKSSSRFFFVFCFLIGPPRRPRTKWKISWKALMCRRKSLRRLDLESSEKIFSYVFREAQREAGATCLGDMFKHV